MDTGRDIVGLPTPIRTEMFHKKIKVRSQNYFVLIYSGSSLHVQKTPPRHNHFFLICHPSIDFAVNYILHKGNNQSWLWTFIWEIFIALVYTVMSGGNKWSSKQTGQLFLDLPSCFFFFFFQKYVMLGTHMTWILGGEKPHNHMIIWFIVKLKIICLENGILIKYETTCFISVLKCQIACGGFFVSFRLQTIFSDIGFCCCCLQIDDLYHIYITWPKVCGHLAITPTCGSAHKLEAHDCIESLCIL